MYIDIWFIQVLPTFSRFDTSSRLRNYSKMGKSQMNHISINGVRSYFKVVALAPSFCGESSFGVIRDLSEGVHLKCRQFKNGFEKF